MCANMLVAPQLGTAAWDVARAGTAGAEAQLAGAIAAEVALDAYVRCAELNTPVAQYALERGGHLQVGVEDAAGATDMTNAETVEAAVALAAAAGRPVAEGQAAVAVLQARSAVPA